MEEVKLRTALCGDCNCDRIDSSCGIGKALGHYSCRLLDTLSFQADALQIAL